MPFSGFSDNSAQLAHHFIRGLNSRLIGGVKVFEPKTLKDAVHRDVLVEQSVNLGHGGFNNLIRKFVTQYFYNIEQHASLSDLCYMKQQNGEIFSNFLQWQRHLANCMPYKIEDSHLMDIFIKKLIPEMSFHMKLASSEDFPRLVKKGKNNENGLLDKGAIKHYSSSSSNNDTNNNRKPKFWSNIKGVMHDGVTNVKSIQNLQGGNNNNNYRN